MADTGFIVQVLRLGISGSAGLRDASPYQVKSHDPVRFDFDVPNAFVVHPRRDKPTIFATEKEAKEKTDDVIARVRALLRIQARGGNIPSVGQATMLIPHDYGSGEIGGYEIVPAAGWLSERDEEARFAASVAQEELAQADSEAQRAQAKADALRGELGEVKVAPRAASDTSKWVATDVPRVQVYARRDGSQSFRGRKDGGVSPSYDTKEEVVSWLEGEAPPEKASPDRTAALEALGDVMMRS